MGKVVKAVAVVGLIAINVIPGAGQIVSGSLVALFSGTAIGAGGTFAALGAAAAVSSALGTLGVVAALGVIGKAVGLGPKGNKVNRASESLPSRTMPGLSGGMFSRGGERRARMQPIRPWYHLRRWQVNEISGDCLVPHCPDSREVRHYMLVDRRAEIRPDDIVTFRTKSGDSLSKRFVTATDDSIVFETTNPHVERHQLRKSEIICAYRERAHLRDFDDADRRIDEIKANPNAHNERLGICVFSEALLA